MFKLSSKRLALAAVALVAVASATAYAYWSTTGSGTGSAKTGRSVPVVISQVGEVKDLAPGAPAQPVAIKINNPANFPQFVRRVNVAVGSIEKVDRTTGAVTAVPETECSAADFAIDQAKSPIATDLPPGDTEIKGADQAAMIRMVNRDVDQNGCKNVTVNLAFTTSASSSSAG